MKDSIYRAGNYHCNTPNAGHHPPRIQLCDGQVCDKSRAIRGRVQRLVVPLLCGLFNLSVCFCRLAFDSANPFIPTGDNKAVLLAFTADNFDRIRRQRNEAQELCPTRLNVSDVLEINYGRASLYVKGVRLEDQPLCS